MTREVEREKMLKFTLYRFKYDATRDRCHSSSIVIRSRLHFSVPARPNVQPCRAVATYRYHACREIQMRSEE